MITVWWMIATAIITFIATSHFFDFWKNRKESKDNVRAQLRRALESDDHKQIRAAAVQHKPDIEKETFIFMINRADSLEAGAVFAREDHSKLLAHVFDWKLLSKDRWRSGSGAIQNRISCTSFLEA